MPHMRISLEHHGQYEPANKGLPNQSYQVPFEGLSIRATARMAGVGKNSIIKLLHKTGHCLFNSCFTTLPNTPDVACIACYGGELADHVWEIEEIVALLDASAKMAA